MWSTEENNLRFVVGYEKIQKIFTKKLISFFLLHQLEQPGTISGSNF